MIKIIKMVLIIFVYLVWFILLENINKNTKEVTLNRKTRRSKK